ncbi:hypothetical protein OC842_003014 [Tilletia horrida]|uniref:Condensin complex subunit 2 n=1 Tax=Tilletia horrida TaxID=155126 RepID=A0AAN6GCI4_9BASI|nr:hypothetical protein OC842_003014 [Tilletia horrida]KAK0564285.1 hypothetical protein OC844_001781 [Tilletia horrida]
MARSPARRPLASSNSINIVAQQRSTSHSLSSELKSASNMPNPRAAAPGAGAAAAAANAIAGPSRGRPSSRLSDMNARAIAGAAALIAAPGTGTSAAAAAAAAAVVAAGGPARLRVDNTSFEEWMKMATDNKINSNNTWSFALIDYFHDMSLLRSDSGDGTINFQKASCTLDGCVKVWTSRVDSVVVETGRLLSGLQDDTRPGRRDEDGDGDGEGGSDDDAADDLDGEDGEGGSGTGRGKGKKRRNNKEVTLAKHFSQIKIKNFDLEFTVDPLFKKTSADFDEGGAGGLLMNHLGVDRRMRVVFDASDVAGVDEEDDEEKNEAAQADTEAARALREADQIDISKLQSKLFGVPEEEASERVPHLAAMLNRRFVCPSLRMFKFDREDKTSFAEFVHRAAEADAELDAQDDDMAVDNDVGAGFEQGPNFMDIDAGAGDLNFGGDDDDVNMDFLDQGAGSGSGWRQDSLDIEGEEDLEGKPRATDDDAPEVDAFADLDLAGAQDFPMPDPDQDADGSDAFAGEDAVGALGADGRAPAGPFTRPGEHDIMMAMNAGMDVGAERAGGLGSDAGEEEREEGEGGRNLFDYFDQRFMKNWAGPEHWKMRKVIPSAGTAAAAAANAGSKDDAATSSKTGEKRKAREAFSFTFSVDEAPDPKKLFATSSARGAATITLPKSSMKGKNRDQFLLPEDQHYNSKQLLRLFVKPKVMLQMRRRGVVVHADDDLMGLGAADGLDHIDDGFWAQQAAERDQDGAMGGNDMYDDYDALGGMPFDDGDDMGIVVGGDEGATQLELVRKVKPEMVNYAKKATRVDIRKLKENIWKELGIGADGAEVNEKADVPQTPTTAAEASAASGSGKRFAQVLGGLRANYAKEKMDEISTSFCFICLLHLANEEGLQISLGKDSGGGGVPGTVIRATAEDDALGGEEGEEDEDEDEDEGEEVAGTENDGQKEVLDVERARRDWEREMRRVGHLEQLVIAKDPTAGRSA